MAHIPPPPPGLTSPVVQHAELRKLAADPAVAFGDPFWRYLRFRHDSNPARFDRCHRAIGRLIEALERPAPAVPVPSIPLGPVSPGSIVFPPVIPIVPPSVTGAPPGCDRPGGPPEDHDHLHATPGPGSWLILSLGLVGAFLAARVRRPLWRMIGR